MKFSDDDICSGCVFEDGEFKSQCKIKLAEVENDCPCVECLLKGICENYCDAYKELIDKIMRK